GQAATGLSKVTPGKAGSTSVALMHPGTLDAGRDKPVRGRLATLEGTGRELEYAEVMALISAAFEPDLVGPSE
ncbi:hypothetical protein M9458_044117, partial [Cirrhinus mrigala]